MPCSGDPNPQHAAAVFEFGRFVFLQKRDSPKSLYFNDHIELLALRTASQVAGQHVSGDCAA
jgi:hypothetical protein